MQEDYTNPYVDPNAIAESEAAQQKEKEEKKAALGQPELNPDECTCCGPLLMDEEKQVAICKQCHDVPYKMEWLIKPPAHTVYKKNLVSDEGYPTVVLTKKNGTR